MLGDYVARRGLKFHGDGVEARSRWNNGMSELLEHFILGSRWPLRKDEPGDNRGGMSRFPRTQALPGYASRRAGTLLPVFVDGAASREAELREGVFPRRPWEQDQNVGRAAMSRC